MQIKQFTRQCPQCGKVLEYGQKSHYTRADRKGSVCHSCSKMGKNNPLFGKTGENHPNFGKTLSDETKAKLSAAMAGKRTGANNPLFGKTGENHPVYKADEDRSEKTRLGYWAKAVMEQDDYTCQMADVGAGCSGRLEAHHIFPRDEYPEIRFDVTKGMCLCRRHHMQLHAVMRKEKKNV